MASHVYWNVKNLWKPIMPSPKAAKTSRLPPLSFAHTSFWRRFGVVVIVVVVFVRSLVCLLVCCYCYYLLMVSIALHLHLGQHLDLKGNHERALEYIEKAIAHTPTFTDLYTVKGKILKHTGEQDTSTHADRLSSCHPVLPLSHRTVAMDR